MHELCIWIQSRHALIKAWTTEHIRLELLAGSYHITSPAVPYEVQRPACSEESLDWIKDTGHYAALWRSNVSLLPSESALAL